MKKIFTSICAILACEHLLSNDGKVTLEDGQLEQIETAITTDKQKNSQLQAQVQTLTAEKQALAGEKQQLESANKLLEQDRQQIENDRLLLQSEKKTLADSNAQLEAEIAELKGKPATTSPQVVSDKNSQPDNTGMQAFFNTRCNARKLFDQMP